MIDLHGDLGLALDDMEIGNEESILIEEETRAVGRFADVAETFGLEHGFEAVGIDDRRVTTEYVEATGRLELLHRMIDAIRERSHAISSPRAQWQAARDVLGDLDTSELPQIGDL